MKLVNSATSIFIASSRCSVTPIDEASIAQAAKPRAAKSRSARCSVTGSGVVRPVEITRASGATRLGGSPTPSVPTTPQRRPARLSACASHQAVEVLPLVPVVATTSSRRLGCSCQAAASGAVLAFSAGSAAMRASAPKSKASMPSASTRQAAAPAASAAGT